MGLAYRGLVGLHNHRPCCLLNLEHTNKPPFPKFAVHFVGTFPPSQAQRQAQRQDDFPVFFSPTLAKQLTLWRTHEGRASRLQDLGSCFAPDMEYASNICLSDSGFFAPLLLVSKITGTPNARFGADLPLEVVLAPRQGAPILVRRRSDIETECMGVFDSSFFSTVRCFLGIILDRDFREGCSSVSDRPGL